MSAIRIFPFSDLLLNETRTCSICLEDFKDDAMIVQLECSKFHIFHVACLENYLRNGRNVDQCPLCRKPIKIRQKLSFQ